MLAIIVSNSRQTKKFETNRHTRNRVCYILDLKCDIWGNNFNDFPDNQLTNLFDQLIPDFYPPAVKFLWSIALRPPVGWTPLTDDVQTDVSLSAYLRSFDILAPI